MSFAYGALRRAKFYDGWWWEGGWPVGGHPRVYAEWGLHQLLHDGVEGFFGGAGALEREDV